MRNYHHLIKTTSIYHPDLDSEYISYRPHQHFLGKMLMRRHGPGIDKLWSVSLNIGKAHSGANFKNSFPVILIHRFPRGRFQSICQILASGVVVDGVDLFGLIRFEFVQHSSHLLEPILHGLFPHLVQTRIDAIHYIFRKCGHLSEYGVLALLLWRAIGNTRRQPEETQRLQSVQGSWKWKEAGLAMVIVFLSAALDEFHQVFVPERTPLISDIFIDTCGGAAAILTLRLLGRWRKSW